MVKYFLIFLIATAICNPNIERQKEIAAKINRLKTTWTAQAYDRDYTVHLGTFLGHNELPKKVRTTEVKDLPENFDLRDKYPNCKSLHQIWDQSECGSDWAFGSSHAMSDRICIKSKGEKQMIVSAQYLTTCCATCG